MVTSSPLGPEWPDFGGANQSGGLPHGEACPIQTAAPPAAQFEWSLDPARPSHLTPCLALPPYAVGTLMALAAACLTALVVIAVLLQRVLSAMATNGGSANGKAVASPTASATAAAAADDAAAGDLGLSPNSGDNGAIAATATAAAKPVRTWSRPQLPAFIEAAVWRGSKANAEQLDALYLCVQDTWAHAQAEGWRPALLDAWTEEEGRAARVRWLDEPFGARARAVAETLEPIIPGISDDIVEAMAVALRVVAGIISVAALPAWATAPRAARPATIPARPNAATISASQRTEVIGDSDDDDGVADGDGRGGTAARPSRPTASGAATTAGPRGKTSRAATASAAGLQQQPTKDSAAAKRYAGKVVAYEFRKSDGVTRCGHEHKNVFDNKACRRYFEIEFAGYEDTAQARQWQWQRDMTTEEVRQCTAEAAALDGLDLATLPTRMRSRAASDASATSRTSAAGEPPACTPPAALRVPASAKAVAGSPQRPTHSNGLVTIMDVRGDGACGAHALCIIEGHRHTSAHGAAGVYKIIADELERSALNMPGVAAMIASEAKTAVSAETAVRERLVALRAGDAMHHLTTSDIDAYAHARGKRVAVVSATPRGEVNTQYLGRWTPHTAVLIIAAGHYRVALPGDGKGATLFAEDALSDALEFVRSHAISWATAAATAPLFPHAVGSGGAENLYAARAAKAEPAPAQAARPDTTPRPSAPPPPAKPAKVTGPTNDAKAPQPRHGPAPAGTWSTKKSKIAHVKTVATNKAVAISIGADKTPDIGEVEARLQAEADMTLSAFARRWTIAAGGALHVEATSHAMYTALLAEAANVRKRTHKGGYVDITAAAAPATAAAAQQAKPPAGETKSRESGRGRGRGGGRGRGYGRGRGGHRQSDAAPEDRAPAADAALRELLNGQREIVRQMARDRARSPPPGPRAPPQRLFCQFCGRDAHEGRCAVRAAGNTQEWRQSDSESHSHTASDPEGEDDRQPPRGHGGQWRGHDHESGSSGSGSGSSRRGGQSHAQPRN